jgi:hypothetical protein
MNRLSVRGSLLAFGQGLAQLANSLGSLPQICGLLLS